MELKLTCKLCGKDFIAHRSDTKYCTSHCRREAWRLGNNLVPEHQAPVNLTGVNSAANLEVDSILTYSELEKNELIEQWKQSGLNRLKFCTQNKISYQIFCQMVRGNSKPATSQTIDNPFISVKLSDKVPSVKPSEMTSRTQQPFVQLSFKNGTSIYIYQPVQTDYILTLMKHDSIIQ